MYSAHPCPELGQLFALRPFQGAHPHEARFLFVGLDANYDLGIADSSVFSQILEYQTNGVLFWQRRGVHHPFLLSSYRGSGRFYHQSFSRIGFTPHEAHQVSFLELLHLPTHGRSNLSVWDLDPTHLSFISSAILQGKARYILVSDSVARLMRLSGQFTWLPRQPSAKQGSLDILYQGGGKTVFRHLHFSVYGKFNATKQAQALDIAALRSRA